MLAILITTIAITTTTTTTITCHDLHRHLVGTTTTTMKTMIGLTMTHLSPRTQHYPHVQATVVDRSVTAVLLGDNNILIICVICPHCHNISNTSTPHSLLSHISHMFPTLLLVPVVVVVFPTKHFKMHLLITTTPTVVVTVSKATKECN